MKTFNQLLVLVGLLSLWLTSCSNGNLGAAFQSQKTESRDENAAAQSKSANGENDQTADGDQGNNNESGKGGESGTPDSIKVIPPREPDTLRSEEGTDIPTETIEAGDDEALDEALDEAIENESDSEKAQVKKDLKACAEFTQAKAIKVVSIDKEIALDPETALFIKVTGNKPTLKLAFEGPEGEATEFAGVCVFATGNQSSVSIASNALVKAVYLRARGNQAKFSVDLNAEASIESMQVDFNGNKPQISINAPDQVGSCVNAGKKPVDFCD